MFLLSYYANIIIALFCVSFITKCKKTSLFSIHLCKLQIECMYKLFETANKLFNDIISFVLLFYRNLKGSLTSKNYPVKLTEIKIVF